MKIEMASRLVPSEKQMEWQNLELTAFLHFGMNTFTDREWGDGKELPSTFNPDALDTDQWVRTLTQAGFNMVILTAKHHDGFCLWPTATTEHSVKNSPWMNGQGDVVKMLRESCDKYGMKMGVYLSPWDRNASCYGDSEKYNDMFVAQLTELLTNYGKIDEVWFDGANGEGPNGKKQEYDWIRFREVMNKLQPDAVLAIMGDDVRWVGNEGGQGRETEWSATALTPGIYADASATNERLGLNAMSADLGGRELIEKADKLYWWPSEVDVSIRPGWFYHATEKPRELNNLASIYLNSVGRNSVLLLNIPPDTHGRISDDDVARLLEFREWIDTNFGNNLITAALPRYTYEIGEGPTEVNCVVLHEDITQGQRVEEFTVQAMIDDKWHIVARGTTIGMKRILTFPEVKTNRLRVSVSKFRGKEYNIEMTGAYLISLPEIPQQVGPTPQQAKVQLLPQQPAGEYKIIPRNELRMGTNVNGGTTVTLTIDMGEPTAVMGLKYHPITGKLNPGMVFKYRVITSVDGKNWFVVNTPGEFGNIVNNPIDQFIYFNPPIKTRYIRFKALEEAEGNRFMDSPDISVLVPAN